MKYIKHSINWIISWYYVYLVFKLILPIMWKLFIIWNYEPIDLRNNFDEIFENHYPSDYKLYLNLINKGDELLND